MLCVLRRERHFSRSPHTCKSMYTSETAISELCLLAFVDDTCVRGAGCWPWPSWRRRTRGLAGALWSPSTCFRTGSGWPKGNVAGFLFIGAAASRCAVVGHRERGGFLISQKIALSASGTGTDVTGHVFSRPEGADLGVSFLWHNDARGGVLRTYNRIRSV